MGADKDGEYIMQTTTHLGLKKPDKNEYVIISDLNDNADILDEAIEEKVNSFSGDISETVVETLETVEDKFPIPSAGDKIKRFLGKVLVFMKNIKPLNANVTYYVAATGSDIMGDGTETKPFKTIQRASDALPKDLGGYTATIIIANGVYDETVNVLSFQNGRLIIRSFTPGVVSSSVKVNRIQIYFCHCQVEINGIELTHSTSGAAITSDTSIDIIIRAVKIVTPSSYNGIDVFSKLVRILDSEISNRNIAVSFADTSGYVSYCTGTGNTYSVVAHGASVCKVIGSEPGSTNGISYSQGGSIFYGNGTQITGTHTSGLSCAWGTLTGGYYRHGNTTGGPAMVTIQCAVTLTNPISANTEYTIGGFPRPYESNVGLTVTAQRYANDCWLDGNGLAHMYFNDGMYVGYTVLISATYFTNS